MPRVVSLFLPTWPTDRVRRQAGSAPFGKMEAAQEDAGLVAVGVTDDPIMAAFVLDVRQSDENDVDVERIDELSEGKQRQRRSSTAGHSGCR
jgi:hypothetical protein